MIFSSPMGAISAAVAAGKSGVMREVVSCTIFSQARGLICGIYGLAWRSHAFFGAQNGRDLTSGSTRARRKLDRNSESCLSKAMLAGCRSK